MDMGRSGQLRDARLRISERSRICTCGRPVIHHQWHTMALRKKVAIPGAGHEIRVERISLMARREYNNLTRFADKKKKKPSSSQAAKTLADPPLTEHTQ